MASEQKVSFRSRHYLDKFDLVVPGLSDGSVPQCCRMIWQALAISRFGTFGDGGGAGLSCFVHARSDLKGACQQKVDYELSLLIGRYIAMGDFGGGICSGVNYLAIRKGYMLAWYRDPQPVQQDEPDHDPGIEENHFADYDTSGDIPGTAIYGPPSHLTFPTCDYTTISVPRSTATTPNDNGVLASLVDERVLTEDFLRTGHSLMFALWMQTAGLDDEDIELSIEAVTQPRFPLQFTPSLEGIHIPRCQILPFTSGIQSHISFKLVSLGLHRESLY
ncbi:uncharacterized protein HD556DRAFT_1307660 [Suillus plorans]|uniref:Uncharacterized protein n=1 Tax=Suillus plorans TaxID=116603 RepID=A0A9P7ARI6_9AGAM|nr:uncharacterized protein HD556DRAFT_1307660 [Suillus plorans]KAG1795060.1 hypothetical protein HD556DRAFT_1307660 [Suillus plorans]